VFIIVLLSLYLYFTFSSLFIVSTTGKIVIIRGEGYSFLITSIFCYNSSILECSW